MFMISLHAPRDKVISYLTDLELQYKSCSSSMIFRGSSRLVAGGMNFSTAETDRPALLRALIFCCKLLDLTEMIRK